MQQPAQARLPPIVVCNLPRRWRLRRHQLVQQTSTSFNNADLALHQTPAMTAKRQSSTQSKAPHHTASSTIMAVAHHAMKPISAKCPLPSLFSSAHHVYPMECIKRTVATFSYMAHPAQRPRTPQMIRSRLRRSHRLQTDRQDLFWQRL